MEWAMEGKANVHLQAFFSEHMGGVQVGHDLGPSYCGIGTGSGAYGLVYRPTGLLDGIILVHCAVVCLDSI
jgi:hypothetical protein